jgi:hypothetical protein
MNEYLEDKIDVLLFLIATTDGDGGGRRWRCDGKRWCNGRRRCNGKQRWRRETTAARRLTVMEEGDDSGSTTDSGGGGRRQRQLTTQGYGSDRDGGRR